MDEQLRKAIEGTADYLYGYHGDPVDPELRKSIDMLRQLINEEFVVNRKMVSSQIIHDILNIEALLATEYDRGKVDGAIEELSKQHDDKYRGEPCSFCMGESTSIDHSAMTDRLAELKGLKSKGESK